MSPKLYVTLSEGHGIVIVDGSEKGKTGEVIRNVQPGERHITVFPNDPLLILTEQEQVAKVSWRLAATDVHFGIAYYQ